MHFSSRIRMWQSKIYQIFCLKKTFSRKVITLNNECSIQKILFVKDWYNHYNKRVHVVLNNNEKTRSLKKSQLSMKKDEFKSEFLHETLKEFYNSKFKDLSFHVSQSDSQDEIKIETNMKFLKINLFIANDDSLFFENVANFYKQATTTTFFRILSLLHWTIIMSISKTKTTTINFSFSSFLLSRFVFTSRFSQT